MERNNITISIIIPAYNIAAYISDCLDSIIPQLGDSVEIIIINDGSTDDTGTICNSYSAPNIKIFHQPTNRGVSSARNKGLQVARGEYIFFVDGDDLLAPNALAQLENKIAASRADIISGSFVKFHSPLNITQGKSLDSAIIAQIESQRGHDAFKSIIENGVFLPSMCNNICKKSLLTDNEITFNPDLVNNEDLDCAMNAYMYATKIAILKEPHYYYRQSRPKSATNTYTKKRVEDSLFFVETWLVKINKLPKESSLRVWLMDYMAYQYSIILGSLALTPRKDRIKLLERARHLNHLLSSNLTRRTRLIGLLSKIIGVKLLSLFLSRVIRLKSLVNRYA